MKTLHLSIIAILIIGIFVTMCIPSVFAENNTLKLGPPASNMSIQQVNAGENMSRSTIHGVYPPVNVTKFMSIAENSTTFKEQINGYAHYSLATVILKPESQNTSNPTIEYNLVYSLYKDPNNYCSYDKVLVITLDVQLQITNTMEYSPYGVPAGYPLPPISCPMNFVPSTIDYNKLVGTIPWSPPLEQLNYGISAENIQCSNGLILVLKSEDGSPACVKPDTAQKLIERGWAKITVTKATFDVIQSNTTQTNAMANLGNDTGITTIGNQAYYFETPNYSHDAYFKSPQISFHDVIFTLFPSGFRGGLPAIHCGLQGSGLGAYYWVDSKFSDNTHELLHLFAYSPSVCNLPMPSMFSDHANPQAGLIFYDGKMKLLVSVENK
ncbi:MAG: hypothetical protein KGI05_02785 [Thaumarchaeota archaeon]|nr:hypothetical protein [Nitrososphaerota archaeon]